MICLFQTVCKNRPDKEEVPCNECGKLFPTRKHLSEHRRTKHRAEQPLVSSAPVMLVQPQNMGHNLGQYFSSKPLPPPPHHHQSMLPPFSRQYHGHGTTPVVSGHGSTEKSPVRCELCHAYFPTEAVLKEHLTLHWSHQLEQTETKVMTSDLTLTQVHDHQSEAENVGSLLRQVYHTEHHHDHHHHHQYKHHAIPEPYCSDYQPPAFDNFLYYNA